MKTFGKFKLLLMGLFTLGAVSATAISTFAWFTINQPPLTNEMISGSPNITIDNDNVYGYKITPNSSLDNVGGLAYSNNVVTKRQTNASDFETTNYDQEGEDVSFDIPDYTIATDAGVGYYLIKKSGDDFKYANVGTKKFTEYNGPTCSYVSSYSVSVGDVLRVKRYDFDTSADPVKTLNQKYEVTSLVGSNAATIANLSNGDITIKKAGTYKIWLDTNAGTLSFDEGTPDLTTLNTRSAKISGAKPKRTNSAVVSGVRTETTTHDTTKLFLKVDYVKDGQSWGDDGARFAAYFFGSSGDSWSSMSNADTGDSNVYSVTIPDSNNTTVIFCRMNGGTSANNWDNVWNQSDDLTVSGHLGHKFYPHGFEVDKPGSSYWNSYYDIPTVTYHDQGYYLVGDGKVGEGLNLTLQWGAGLKLDDATTDGNTAQLSGIYMKKDTTFKVFHWDGSAEHWWGIDNLNESGASGDFSNSEGNIQASKNIAFNIFLKNDTLYVAYHSYSVTLNVNGGTIDSGDVTSYMFGTTTNLPTNVSYPGGLKTFVGWYNNSGLSGSKVTSIGSAEHGAKTYYAKWTDYTSNYYTVYLYDVKGTGWDSFYCYAYGGSNYPTAYHYASADTETIGGKTRYEYHISKEYNSIIFHKGSSFTGNNYDKTVDIGSLSSREGKVYVITSQHKESGDDYDKYYGDWYSTVQENPSSTKRTYRFFDPNGYLRTNSGTPTVYAWHNNAVGGIYYLTTNNASYPGQSLSPVDGMDNVYSCQLSETFENFQLNSGGANPSFQSSDFDSLSAAHAYIESTQKQYFVLTGSSTGSWQTDIHLVSLKVSFFLRSGTSGSYSYQRYDKNAELIKNDYSIGSDRYAPSLTPSDINNGNLYVDGDAANGILYDFTPDTSSWFTDEACTSVYNSGASGTYQGDLFCRAYCDITRFESFYIANTSASLTLKDSAGNTYFTMTNCTATNLFRITIRNDWKFKVGDNANEFGASGSTATKKRPDAAHDVLYVYGNEWIAPKASLFGTATISVGGGSPVKMTLGNAYEAGYANSTHYMKANTNFFMYEKGVVATANQTLSITVSTASGFQLQNESSTAMFTTTTTLSTRAALLSATKSMDFLTPGSDSDPIRFSKDGRYTIYITKNGQISISQVPSLGNGYYIMDSSPASWSDPTGAAVFVRNDSGKPSDCKAQYKATLEFGPKDVWKVRSADWLDFTLTTGTGVDMTQDINDYGNITVNAAGKFDIYFKIMNDDTYQVYVGASTGTNTTSSATSFEANTYYVVGNCNYSEGGTQNPVSVNEGFLNGKKMASSGDSAYYYGFYAVSGQRIFIRSYIDAVDTLYTTRDAHSSSLVTMGTGTEKGVITFNKGGYYNIDVDADGSVLIVGATNADAFFSLNRLDTSSAGTVAAVKNQKTSLVLEVPFTCNNPYRSKMSISVNDTLRAFAGVSVHFQNSPLEDPYVYMRSHCYDDGAGNSLLTQADVVSPSTDYIINANDSGTHYAYILIDYVPGVDSSTLVGSLGAYFQFYVRAVQL